MTAQPWTGRTVLFALLTVFGVVFAVNGVFVFAAFKTWPGLSQNDAYEKGLRYNEVIRAARAQKDLGWRSAVEIASTGAIRIRLVGRDERAINVTRADVVLDRPLGDAASRTISLSQNGDGTLTAETTPLLRGIWHATLTAEAAGGEIYRMQHVVELRP